MILDEKAIGLYNKHKVYHSSFCEMKSIEAYTIIPDGSNRGKKIKVTDDGKCIIGLIWYRVYLTDKITISSHCLEKDAAEHWSPIALLLSENIKKDKLIQITHNLNDEESRMEVKLRTSHF